MTIYHGSEEIVYVPKYGAGRKSNDYGRGFYCTEYRDLSGEWACKKGNDGYINRYSLNPDGLFVCDLNGDDYNILNWLALLTENRGYWQRKSIAEDAKTYIQEHFSIDISAFDIIIGYRADDSYFSFVQDFVMGTISLEKLAAAMKLGGLSRQIVLKSPEAFARVKFEGYETADASVYYVKKKTRDETARSDYRRLVSSADRKSEIYVLDIMRGRVSEDELRVQ